MTVSFNRSAAQQATLNTLLTAQQNPSSSSYHQWLTAAQFGEQFGMSQQDLDQVTAWLQSQGFTVNAVAESRTSIRFSGTAGMAEQALPYTDPQLRREWADSLCQRHANFAAKRFRIDREPGRRPAYGPSRSRVSFGPQAQRPTVRNRTSPRVSPETTFLRRETLL